MFKTIILMLIVSLTVSGCFSTKTYWKDSGSTYVTDESSALGYEYEAKISGMPSGINSILEVQFIRYPKYVQTRVDKKMEMRAFSPQGFFGDLALSGFGIFIIGGPLFGAVPGITGIIMHFVGLFGALALENEDPNKLKSIPTGKEKKIPTKSTRIITAKSSQPVKSTLMTAIIEGSEFEFRTNKNGIYEFNLNELLRHKRFSRNSKVTIEPIYNDKRLNMVTVEAQSFTVPFLEVKQSNIKIFTEFNDELRELGYAKYRDVFRVLNIGDNTNLIKIKYGYQEGYISQDAGNIFYAVPGYR